MLSSNINESGHPIRELSKNPSELGTTDLDEHLLNSSNEEFDSFRSSFMQTVFNLTKFYFGISILATPYGFKESGIIGGVVGVILFSSLNVFTVYIQTQAAIDYDRKIKSLSEFSYRVLGIYNKILIDLCIIAVQVGGGIAYLLFIGAQVDHTICLGTEIH